MLVEVRAEGPQDGRDVARDAVGEAAGAASGEGGRPVGDPGRGAGRRAALHEGEDVLDERGDAEPGTAVLAALAADPATTADLDYAWACGESGLATSLRRHLVQQVGMDKKAITFSGYWKLGAARG